MRIYLYILAGITSALMGWNLGQFILTDLGLLKKVPEIVLFPCIAIFLAIGMVLTEIFISNPTRPKLSFRIAKQPLIIAAGLGLVSGLISGGIAQILFLPQIRVPTPIIRTLGWLLIGSSIGLAEGWTWKWRSIEAGDRKKFQQRLKTSVIAASIASFSAALLFELIRQLIGGKFPKELAGIEDPIGFSILGILLGLAFSISFDSPSYIPALRAGAGFEYTGKTYTESYGSQTTILSKAKPYIKIPTLKFVSNSEEEEIEEGLSIQLPTKGKIKIGSADKADVYIPEIPLHAADLVIEARETRLEPNSKYFYTIKVNGETLSTSNPMRLKHNFVLAFETLDSTGTSYETKTYRFVYYNRFLDPQA